MSPTHNIPTNNYKWHPYPAPIPGEQRSKNLQIASNPKKIHLLNLNELVNKRSVRSVSEESQEILPLYPHRFTDFIANKPKAALPIPGYASPEDFLRSNPEESAEAIAQYHHEDPKREVIKLVGLKKTRIDQNTDAVYQRIKNQILASTNSEERKNLSQSFLNQVKSGPEGVSTLESYSQRVVDSMKQELDKITFRGKNRWFEAGAWPNTTNAENWTKEWQPRLNEAKEQVENGVRPLQTRFRQEIDAKVGNLQAELTRLANTPVVSKPAPIREVILPPQVRYVPSQRSGSLPAYKTPFNNYNSSEPEKNGLRHMMRHIGYDVVEDFYECRPADAQKAARSGYENPKEEAVRLFLTGGYQKINDHIRTRCEFYKQEIQRQSSVEAKQKLAQAFLNEMNANNPMWKGYVEQDKNQITLWMEEALDTIQFRKPNRWCPQSTKWFRNGWEFFRGAPWPYTSVKERWNREWYTEGFPAEGRPPRLSAAKSAVRDGLQQAFNEASKTFDSTITALFHELEAAAIIEPRRGGAIAS